MMIRFRLAALAAALLILAPLAPHARAEGSFSDAQKKEMGEVVRQYLLDHPEVLLEVSKALEAKQQQAEESQRTGALQSSAKQIFHSPDDFVAGDPKGDVTMVEFFDYNCGWCKKGYPEVMSLLDKDPNLRFVLKEFPIFGGDSDYAAMAALASKKQGKYWQLHQALFSHQGKVTKDVVDEIAKAQGIDMQQLAADMKSPEVAKTIADNHALAEQLAINGTPAFIIDDKLSPGYLPADGLAELIGRVRTGGGCKLC